MATIVNKIYIHEGSATVTPKTLVFMLGLQVHVDMTTKQKAPKQ